MIGSTAATPPSKRPREAAPKLPPTTRYHSPRRTNRAKAIMIDNARPERANLVPTCPKDGINSR
jgi:hypothetical protein